MNATTRKLIDSLPLGVSVYKQRRASAPKRDLAAVPVGKTPWEVWPGDYHFSFYCRVRLAGVPSAVQSLETDDVAEAVSRAMLVYKRAAAAKWGKAEQAFDAALGRRSFATVGDVIAAFLRVYPGRNREANDFRAVIGWAKGWRSAFERWDAGSDEARRVDALSTGEVLTKRAVLDYFAARQGGRYDAGRVERGNISINRTLCNARLLFGRGAMTHCYDELTLPDLADWLRVPLLRVPEIDREAEAITREQWAAMAAAADALEAGPDAMGCELGLINRMLRLLGLRSKELCAAHGSWLEERGGEWFLAVRNRDGFQVKNGRAGRLRLGKVEDGESLAARLVPRIGGHLILPGGTAAEREDLIRRGHNRWLKGMIGETHSGQGNHRLRKYVATRLRARFGVEAAAMHLRDSEAVARENYTHADSDGLPLVTDGMLK